MKHWKDTIVAPGTPLEQAIQTLDRAALRIALVVDAQGYLHGTLTDGDIRRALIRHQSLAVSVDEVMNPSPQTATSDWNKDRMLATMEKRQILQLPILDAEGRVVGLESLHNLLNQPLHDNPVFLMAGGFGKRLRPLTNDCPKPMLKVGDKPILHLILNHFIQAGFHRFFISTHYMPELIRDYFGDGSQWGVSIQYIHEEEPLGTGGALGLLPDHEIDMPMFVMNGDLLTSVNVHSLLEFHREHPASATMCVREYDYQVPYGVIESEGHHIRSMVEKPTQRFFVNAGIYLLEPELVRGVEPGTRIDMPSLLEKEIADDRKVNMFPVHEYWLDIGQMTDFRKAQDDCMDLFNE